ncbi:MAG: hypothetical protein Q7T57_00125 [Dehalococcoidales bacterium]|nr:hypothetical protein [Dehalococcoidales bacterium]
MIGKQPSRLILKGENMSKWLAVIIGAILLISVLTGAQADKDPIDKAVFVHYPKGALERPLSPPGQVGGVLCNDYKYNGIHWANPSIKYGINPSGFTDTTPVQAAFATWDGASGPLGFSYQGPTSRSGGIFDGYNVVSWENISAQYPNAIAVTTVWYYRFGKQIVEVDTQMNSTLAWSYTVPNVSPDLSGSAIPVASRYADPTNSGVAYDVQNIMTHEAGHWIMLGDLYKSVGSELTMYGYGATGELKKDTLAYGDELGVERVYGP